MALRVAVVNQKGGVGKTTTAVNLAASLAALGHKILLVDLDPQSNATTGIGVDHRELEASIYDVIIDGLSPSEILISSSYPGLDILPASIDLAGAELELVPAFSRERKLRAALEHVDGDYAAVFIDCPPSLGLLTVNALAAAESVLVPIQCEYYALEGLSQLMRNVELVRSGLNPELEIGGIVLTMYDARTKLSEQVAEEVRSYFGDKVFQTVIPRSVRLSEAPSYGQPAVTYDPSARGSMAYRWLGEEFERRFLSAATETPASEAPASETPVPETPSEAPGAPASSVVEDPGSQLPGPDPAEAADVAPGTERRHAQTSESGMPVDAEGQNGPESATAEPADDQEAWRPGPGWALSLAKNLLAGRPPDDDPEDALTIATESEIGVAADDREG